MCPLAGGRPLCEIRHPRKAGELYRFLMFKPMGYRIEESAQDPRRRCTEPPPQFLLLAPGPVWDWVKHDEDFSVGEVAPVDHVGDSVQYDRPTCLEQDLIIVGIKLTHREAAAGRQPAQRVGEPNRQ